MKRVLKITFLIIVGLIAGICICVWNAVGDLVQGALSVQKLDDGLYYMEYHGDDGFDEFLAQGGARNSQEVVLYINQFLSKGYYKPEADPDTMKYGCSALTARTPDGNVLMGRNFDYQSATAMILHAFPQNGYEYISTFSTDFYGFGEGWLPEGFVNQYVSLSNLFFALDGVNEKGFAIADLMAGDNAETHQNTGHPALTTTCALAYMLKKAASVDEAITLLSQIDMHSDIGAAHHYAMSDATGRSVVVEYVDNHMVVTETPAVANHYLCQQKLNAGLIPGDTRYDRLCNLLSDSQGVMGAQQFTNAIVSVAQQPWGENFVGGTQWTMVMNLSQPSVTYYSQRKFDQPHRFELEGSHK